jgi:Tfp pilus assembly protein PilO
MQMNPRERTLAFLVGTVVAIFVTFFLVQFFLKQQRTLTQQIKIKTENLVSMRTLIAERDLWEQRDQWLSKHQPHIDNANSAGVNLLEEVKQIAQKHSLTPTDANIGQASATPRGSGKPTFQPVGVSFKVKGKWEDLVDFLYDVQTPTNFLVFEKAALELDKDDKTQVSASVNMAKWYAAQ